MRLYARPSTMLARQLAADVGIVAWGVLLWFAGQAAGGLVRALAEPSRWIGSAVSGMRDGFADAAGSVAGLPGVGGEIRRPFDAATTGLADIVTAAQAQVAAIEQLAVLVGWLVFVLPLAAAAVRWLPWRFSFVREAAAAQRFIDGPEDLQLMALRAMATQPLHKLAAISHDPVRAWRHGDRSVIEALADLELRRRGLSAPASATAREG